MVEATAQQPMQFYDHLMQSMAEGVLVLDEQGVVIAADEVAAALLGHDAGTLIGCHSQAFWPEDLPLPYEMHKRASRSAKATFRARDGRPVPVTLTITPVSGRVSGFLVAMTGLDEVERFNEALAHTQRLAGIGILTASVAHELNTPISIIAATCSNLQHEVEDNTLSMEQLLRTIEMIDQNTWRAARVIEVLRNYSYGEKLQTAVTDLNMIVEDALTLVRHQFHGQFNVKIEKDLSPDLKSIVCDHNRVAQVLINLLINASDAMQPTGGTITIQSRPLPQATAVVPVNGVTANDNGATAEQYAVSIRDTGHGIMPDIMDKIFDPFFTTKANGKGTGLGLYIARQIVTQHHGRLWAENNPGGGATFTFTLPRSQ